MSKRNATQPPPLGTILPHPRVERLAEEHYIKLKAKKDAIIKSLYQSLKSKGRRVKLVVDRIIIEEEKRLEIDDNKYYAIVTNNLKIRFFELRDGFHYSIDHLP